MGEEKILYRILKDRLFMVAVILLSFLAILPLLFILYYII